MDEQPATPETPRQSKLIAVLVIAFGLFHCASLLFAILPLDWKINSMLAPYRQLTGTHQDWKMFATIPIAQDKKITVEVRDAAGAITSAGPILPGMSEFDLESRIRYYPLLTRLTSPDMIYFGAYVAKLRAAVEEEFGESASEFSVKTETDFIRLLERIQEDGKMTVRKVDVVGPFPLGKQ